MHPCINHSGCEYGYRRGCGYGHGCGAKHPEVRSACTRMPSHDQKTLTHTHTHTWIVDTELARGLREACARPSQGLRNVHIHICTYTHTHTHKFMYNHIYMYMCYRRAELSSPACASNLREVFVQKLAGGGCASPLRKKLARAVFAMC